MDKYKCKYTLEEYFKNKQPGNLISITLKDIINLLSNKKIELIIVRNTVFQGTFPIGHKLKIEDIIDPQKTIVKHRLDDPFTLEEVGYSKLWLRTITEINGRDRTYDVDFYDIGVCETSHTIESYEDLIRFTQSEIDNLKAKLKEKEQLIKDTNSTINFMKDNNLKEMDLEEFKLYEKLMTLE